MSPNLFDLIVIVSYRSHTYEHYRLLKRFRLCRRPDIALVSAGGAGQMLGKQQRDSQCFIKINQKVHDGLSPTKCMCTGVIALWAHKCYMDLVWHGYAEGSAHKLQSQRSPGCQRHMCDPTYTNGISKQGPTGSTRSSNRCCNTHRLSLFYYFPYIYHSKHTSSCTTIHDDGRSIKILCLTRSRR